MGETAWGVTEAVGEGGEGEAVKRPTEPGWYWRYTESGCPQVVHVSRWNDEGPLVVWWAGSDVDAPLSEVDGVFVGPLAMPERPKA